MYAIEINQDCRVALFLDEPPLPGEYVDPMLTYEFFESRGDAEERHDQLTAQGFGSYLAPFR